MPLLLETDRLIIREYTPEDTAHHHRVAVECFDSKGGIGASQAWMEWAVRNYRQLESLGQPPYGDYVIALYATGEPVGAVGLVPSVIPWHVLRDTPPTGGDLLVQPEFGLYWAVLPEHQRRGIASEAAERLIDFVFQGIGARRVVATTEHDNARSQATMRKVGMTLYRNRWGQPFWCEVVGVRQNPAWEG
ncbi:MAG: GNAT family protein [bacterium]|nr:GNAT family protein [bacterium]